MKREELKAKGLTDEQIEYVMAENGRDINAAKADVDDTAAKLSQAEANVTALQQQIKDRDKDIADLKETAKDGEGLNQKLTDLQTKYESDTKALQKKLDDQTMEYAIEKAFADVPFASAMAKKAAISDFRTKGYKPAQDGTFTEAAGYIDQLKKDDPGAFKTEAAGNGNEGDGNGTGDGDNGGNNPAAHLAGNGNAWIPGNNSNQPRFTSPMGGGNAAGANGATGAAAPTGLNFSYVRTPPANK